MKKKKVRILKQVGPTPQRRTENPPHRAKNQKKSASSDLRLAVGVHSVVEALIKHPHLIDHILLEGDPGRLHAHNWPQLMTLAKQHRIEIRPLDKRNRPLGCSPDDAVVALVSGFPEVQTQNFAGTSSQMVCFLDGIQDPHNLGAILRSAWLFGVQAIFLPEKRACPITPVVSKVSCGGLEHVPIERVHFGQKIDELKSNFGFWVFGLDGEASQSLWGAQLPEKVAWIIGSEGYGLRKSVKGYCDGLYSIPQVTQGASLNASVSAALAFSEFARK